MHVTMLDPGNFTRDYVENLSTALASAGVEVDLITSPHLFEESASGSEKHAVRIGGPAFRTQNYFFTSIQGERRRFLRRHAALRRVVKALGYPLGLWRTWRALKSARPGILHVQWALAPLLDALLLRDLRSRGWSIVYTAHEVFFEIGRPLRRWTFRRLYRHIDAVIVHTPGLARRLRADSGDILREVCVIPEGIGMLPLLPDLDRTAARGILGVDVAGPLLMFFGLIKQYKGLQHLLNAWRMVLAEFPEARLLIAGEAMLPMGPVRHRIRELNIGQSVTLRLGYVPRSEVQYFFLAADAVVLPYVRASTSGVIPLAFRYGRPVIATTAGALPEIVEHGQTGLLAPPGAEKGLAEAICQALRDPVSLAAMGARARHRFETDRTWDAAGQRTAALYRSLRQRQSEDEVIEAVG